MLTIMGRELRQRRFGQKNEPSATRKPHLLVAASGLALVLGACSGGGGGGGVASTPPPPQTPTPTPAATAVTIFKTPLPGEFVTVGSSVNGPGGNLDEYASAAARFGTVSTADGDQAHIRYTSGGYYEIKLPSADWDRLVPYKGLVNPPADNNYFQPEGIAENYGYLVTSNSRTSGYNYSELGAWGSAAAGRWGYSAFGVPTSPGGMPITGSAIFNGTVSGSADIMSPDYLYGGYYPASVDGAVNLNFNFGQGSLSGAMTLYLPDGMQPLAIGTYAFKDTIFSVGSTTYSGKFDTSASGQNFFLGQFTGPNAQETIGTWAIPFVFSTGGQTLKADGQTHQAFGAWIAKSH